MNHHKPISYSVAGYKAKRIRLQLLELRQKSQQVKGSFSELRILCSQKEIDLKKIIKDHNLEKAYKEIYGGLPK